jgi:hypothetical protein
MIVYYDRDREYRGGRLYPYGPDADGQRGHIDFRASPGQIRTSLEDFLPFARWPAIQTFYGLLEYLNGPTSRLETVDCAFRGPYSHCDSNSGLALAADGRLFVMYRDIGINCSKDHYQWLCGKLMQELELVDATFPAAEGVVAFSLNSALHVEISDGQWLPSGEFDAAQDDRGMGYHTMLTFWAYGNDEAALFSNLDRVFKNILEVSKSIDKLINDAVSA